MNYRGTENIFAPQYEGDVQISREVERELTRKAHKPQKPEQWDICGITGMPLELVVEVEYCQTCKYRPHCVDGFEKEGEK